jgi:hypothetical protein
MSVGRAGVRTQSNSRGKTIRRGAGGLEKRSRVPDAMAVIQEFRDALQRLQPEELSEVEKTQLRGLLRELQALIQLAR